MEEKEKSLCYIFGLLFLAGFFAGNLLLFGVVRLQPETISQIRLFQVESFLARDISSESCFRYLLRVRFAPALAGVLLGLTTWGALASYLVFLGYGFLVGVFLAAALLQNGVHGLVVFFLALFPQNLLYLPALFLMGTACSKMAEKQYLSGRLRTGEYLSFGAWYGLGMVLVLWGIFLESYISPLLMQKWMKI